MYQRLGTPERSIRPVPFNHGLPDYPSYCLPSLATFDKSGNLFLGDLAAKRLGGRPWDTGLSRFKMLVAGGQDERYLDTHWQTRFREHVRAALGDHNLCTPEALTVTYLAYVMRAVRLWLEREFETTDIDLWFNVCVPVDQRENNKVLAAFERIVGAADVLERDGPGTDTAREWLQKAVDLLQPGQSLITDGAANRVFIVPEAAAALSAYLTSLQREPGLHALVDIGAGTTDVSICNLRMSRERGVHSTWYAARSIPIGAGQIESWLASDLALTRDPNAVTTRLIREALAGAPDLQAECGPRIREVLKTIWHKSAKAWGDAYVHLKGESYWKRTVKVFLAGGGGLIPAAREIFSESWQKGWGPYSCTELPKPDGFDSAALGIPFGRVCVAYGLAIPVPEMGVYVMPAEAPNDTPPRAPHVPFLDSRHDKDQPVPGYGWT